MSGPISLGAGTATGSGGKSCCAEGSGFVVVSSPSYLIGKESVLCRNARFTLAQERFSARASET